MNNGEENMDSKNTRRCGQIGEGEDDELSMVDVLEEQSRAIAEASAVLGGSDEKNCTFPKGYVKRQALYACATCTPKGNAGICLACSYACHEGHDLYELYTKRDFSCDCGNDKFEGKATCKLISEKKGMNSKNHYNQNFKGTYCICARPYPDEEDSIGDEMIQCVMCEDWFHGRHLQTTVPDDFEDMICSECMSKYYFLWAYAIAHGCEVKCEKSSSVDEGQNVDITSLSSESLKTEIETNKPNPSTCTQASDKGNDQQKQEICGVKRERCDNSLEGPSPKKEKLDSESQAPSSEKDNDEEECLLKSLLKVESEHKDHASFWPDGWRKKLCKCTSCLEMYQDRELEYLIDDSDSVQAYEELGRSSEQGDVSEEESEAAIFDGLDRVQQIEVARGVRDFKSELGKFFRNFTQEGKVVTEAAIREFFEGMEKKRREQANTPQYNCR